MVDQQGRITAAKSHKHPGKKRRVQLRKRAAIADASREADAEKRTRRNRDKKIKRRQKGREMKAEAAGQDDGSAVRNFESGV